MADTKITALTAITTVDPAADVLPIVDVSDTSMAASGTTKKITSNQILGAGGTATLASATITGDLTVDTNTLKVDSANNRVGIGTATPRAGFALDVLGNVALGNSTTPTSNRLKLDCVGTAGNVAVMSFAAAGTNKAFYGLSGGFFGDTSTDALIATDAAGAAIRFCVSDTGTEAMRLNATGLGVGVASPTAKLHISGNLKIDGATSEIFMATGAERTISASGSAGATALTFKRWDGVSAYVSDVVMDASGNLLVGKTASSTTVAGSQIQPDGTFSAVKGDANPGFFYNRSTAASGTIALFRSNSVTVGSITQDGTNTSYVTTSDYRLKEDVQPLVGGLARVSALKPSIYKWKTNGSTGEGFLAHELADVVPSAVIGSKDEVNEDGSIKAQGVDLSKVVPVLVAAIQELAARVQTLETR